MTNDLESLPVTQSRIAEKRQYDIVVIGGGVAGVCAAIAAARLGSKVALVQDRPVLGGNSSSEIRVWAVGAATTGYFRNARETGIIEELTIETAYRSEGLLPAYAEPWPMWDLVLKEWCDREPTLDLYLNTKAHAVTVTANRIDSINALQVSTEKAFCLAAAIFIDSSGDGEIAAKAGARWRLGQESRHELGESIAPEEANRDVLPSTLLFSARDAGRPVRFHSPAWAYNFPDDRDLPYRHPTYFKSGYWWIEAGGDQDTINDNEVIRDELHKILFGVWDHIKNHGDHGAENLILDWVGHVVGKRESRRFEGDYIIVQDDVLDGRTFPDDVAFGGWPVDLHPARGIFDAGTPSKVADPARPFGIPYRALYAGNIDNLFLNGRLISASHIAMGSIRVQKTLGIIGQAVGTAAAMCVQHQVSPRQLGQEGIQALQQQLLKHDCYIPHVRNQDRYDLARCATISASSHMPFPELAPSGQHGLYTRRTQKFATSATTIERIAVWLISAREQPVTVRAHLRSAAELWDFCECAPLATATVVVPPGYDGWLPFEFGCAADPAAVYWIEIEPVDGVAWRHSFDEPHGCLAAAWSSSRVRGLKLDSPTPPPAVALYPSDAGEVYGSHPVEAVGGLWRHLRGTYLLRIEPEPYPCRPENVLSGVTRPEQGANLWIADPKQPWPHWLEMNWEQPVTFNMLQLTFDSNLDRQMDEGAKALSGPIPELVKTYSVFIWQQGDWQLLFHEQNNYQRWRRHVFAEVTTQRLRLQFEASQADGPIETTLDPSYAHVPGGGSHPNRVQVAHTARVFEVRVYRESNQ